MRTGQIAHPSRQITMAIVFVAVLVTSFFALAPSVLACHADILFEKRETGAAAPGETYTILVTDQDDRETTVDVAAGETASLTVTPGTYHFVELNAPAGAEIVPSFVVVTDDHDQQTIEVVVTNPYPAGKLAIEKVETGAAAPGGTYTFDIVGPVDLVVEVAAGDTWTSEWLPLGTYTITESDAPAGHTVVPDEVTLTESDDGQTIDVVATNPFLAGKLAIEKVETGDTAPGGTYVFDIIGPDGTEPFAATVVAGDTWTSEWLPLGEYTITERDAPAGHTVTPGTVELTEDGATITVTATNPYRDFHGKLAIEKVETGDTAPGGTYVFDIIGPDGTEPFAATVVAGDTWTSEWLPLGTYTITERNAPTGHSVVPDEVTLTESDDGQTITVIVTNPFRDFHGKLAIEKVETGDTAPGGTYAFDIAGPDDLTLVADVTTGVVWTSEWLPLGEYTITERDAPAGHTVTPGTVDLTEDGATVTVTATNPYRDFHGKLAIQKIESGAGADGGTYTMNVTGAEELHRHREGRRHVDVRLAAARHVHRHRGRRADRRDDRPEPGDPAGRRRDGHGRRHQPDGARQLWHPAQDGRRIRPDPVDRGLARRRRQRTRDRRARRPSPRLTGRPPGRGFPPMPRWAVVRVVTDGI